MKLLDIDAEQLGIPVSSCQLVNTWKCTWNLQIKPNVKFIWKPISQKPLYQFKLNIGRIVIFKNCIRQLMSPSKMAGLTKNKIDIFFFHFLLEINNISKSYLILFFKCLLYDVNHLQI